jgi:predicted small metal-binding protein
MEVFPVAGEGLDFHCLRDGCTFHRTFETAEGLQRYVTEHMRILHGVRLTWAEGAQ